MKSWTALFVPVALIVLGAAPVIYLSALFAWQIATSMQIGSWVPLPAMLLFTDHAPLQAGKAAPVLGFIPDLSWLWRAGADTPPPAAWILGKLHFAIVPALIGLMIAAHGAFRLLRQGAIIRARRREHEDRLRRMHDYRRQELTIDTLGRREPFIANLRG
jgi:hypothetical protein